jgi:hypothetical protein
MVLKKHERVERVERVVAVDRETGEVWYATGREYIRLKAQLRLSWPLRLEILILLFLAVTLGRLLAAL